MEIYKVTSIEDITNELIIKLIERYKENEIPRIEKLQNYYKGKSDILKKTTNDPSKPNNKIVNPFPAYITDTSSSFFNGKPINYQSQDEVLMEKVQAIFDKNHEQAHNSRLVKSLSTTGLAYEMLYSNEENEIKMAMIDPKEVFIIYDNTVDVNPLMAVRFIESLDYITDEITTHVELYTADSIQYGVIAEDHLVMNEEETIPHYFGEVNVIQYKNNDDYQGDFEKIIDLIDAYDLSVSATSDDIESFSDSYLAISGTENAEPEDFSAMKENRIILLGEHGKAEWLVKSSQNVQVEEYKDRLKEDIHSLSHVPDLSGDSFGNATSGEALKYKLFGLENLISIKESSFKESLEKRLKMIVYILNVKGGSHDYTTIKMKFNRNIPTNLTNTADIVSKLAGVVSHETLLSILPIIDDVSLEKAKIEAENNDTMYETFFKPEQPQPVE